MPARQLVEKATLVYALLEDKYGIPDWRPEYEPMDELILTLLSANTSDVNSGRAFRQLKEAYPDWQAAMEAPLEELIEVIRPGGLAPTKAPRIQVALRRILTERGEFDIGFLADRPVEEGIEWLTSFDGVGHKTASIVLLFCFGLPAFPVDTHVRRVSQRLGFADPNASPGKIKGVWEELVPAQWFYPLHLNLIRHGREVCVARSPRCEKCVLQDHCEWYASHGPGGL